MSTPTSNDITSNQAAEFNESEIHVMPEKFLMPKAAAKSKLGTWLLIGVAILAVIGIGVAVIFWLQGQKTAEPAIPTQPLDQNQVATPSSTPVLTQKTGVDRDRERLETMRQLQLALQRYFLQTTAYPRSLDQLIPDFISQVPVDPLTNQPYLYTATEGSFQISFTLEEGTAWGVTLLPPGKYLTNATAIVPENEQSVVSPVSPTSPTSSNQSTAQNENPTPPTIGLDTDNDGLTDLEEQIYRTSSTKADTDGDGYSDGEEVIGGYDPAVKVKRIWEAATTAVYRNQNYGYSVIYPKNWPIRSVDNGQEVFFTESSTNEFFDVLVEDNPLGMSAINWYLRQNPNVNVNLLTPITVANTPAIQTADGLITYVSSGTKLYIISYHIGVGKEANFFATYKMFLKTWQLNVPITKTVSTSPTSTDQNSSSTNP